MKTVSVEWKKLGCGGGLCPWDLLPGLYCQKSNRFHMNSIWTDQKTALQFDDN